MTLSLLADTAAAAAEDTISTKLFFGVLTCIVSAAVGAVMRFTGRHKWREQGREQGKVEERARLQGNVTIDSPVPKITIRNEGDPVTDTDLEAHLKTIRESFSEVWTAIDGERGIARTALGNVHARLNDAFTKLDHLDGLVTGINENVGRLLDRAMNLPPGTTVSRRTKKTP